MNKTDHFCPSCGSNKLRIFHEVNHASVHSVLLLSTREKAQNYTTGNISLAHCHNCGFISNAKFDPSLHEYSSRYEETQGFSPTFNVFQQRLAELLIEKFDLHNKDVLEIGCGKGEFLVLLCDMGQNRGLGFDPAYVPGRVSSDRATFIKDFYSEKYAVHTADFVCCKMTLEHIQDVSSFINVVRRSIGDNEETIVFFQVPDVRRILQEVAFWDVYYEHCSYFSLGSLARLFRNSGFEIIDLWGDYGDHYLMIACRPRVEAPNSALEAENDLEKLHQEVNFFVSTYPQKFDEWTSSLRSFKEEGCRVVLWGGGSKGVAFLTTLGIGLDTIRYVVDINPFKTGYFMAGSGQEIVSPEFLNVYKPKVVISMNPIYREEIQRDLHERGLSPRLLTV